MLVLKDFRVTDSLGLKDFRVKGIWRSHDLGVKPSSACYELRMLQRDRVQWITDADTPSCGQKKHTRWPATNAKCWLAIVRSEKTHTLACNEFFGLQWITDAAARSCAMNYGCWYAIVRSEKTHTLARNEFQVLIVPSCGQKRHTRWPATNSGWWCDHTRWHATKSGWCCALVPSETCQRMLGFKEFRVKTKLGLNGS